MGATSPSATRCLAVPGNLGGTASHRYLGSAQPSVRRVGRTNDVRRHLRHGQPLGLTWRGRSLSSPHDEWCGVAGRQSLVRLAVLAVLVAGCERAEPSADPPGRPTSTTAAEATRPGLRVQEYPVPAGSRPHDVAPAAEGRSVWYTAQGSRHYRPAGSGHRGEPADPLGDGSAPHGVIVGPDGAPWVTDGGLNAIVRVDPRTEKVDRYPLPPGRGSANLNTATFRGGVLWFTGQAGVLGRLDPKVGRSRGVRRPPGAGAAASPPPPGGRVFYASWPATSVASTTGRARPRCCSRPPATRAPGGSGRIPAAGSG